MPETKPDDTRRLLKLFGVAVTDFEEQSAELVARIATLDAGASRDLAAALRELLEMISETTEKWQDVTEHLFALQRRVLAEVAQALP